MSTMPSDLAPVPHALHEPTRRIPPDSVSAGSENLVDAGDDPLGSAPHLAAGIVAQRAKQAIKARLFPERLELAPHIGRFTILRELGRGGMGVVYMAYDEALDRRVAIKLLYEISGDDTDGQARLLREAQAMARLNHPNIAAVYEVGTHEGRVFIAMEFVQGQSLDVWLGDAQRSWKDIVEAFVQAGRGLHAAHCAGLVHRDFKPANVMLGSDGRVRVLDFGLARGTQVLEPDAELGSLATTSVTMPALAATLASPQKFGSPLTQEGTIVGTPAYMPPEQFRGESLDARADQYALCVSLFEALYGRHPFRGDTLTELWSSVLAGPPKVPPRSSRIPVWLYRIIARGLAPDPAQRFPSMTALLIALARRPTRVVRNWLLLMLLAGAVVGTMYNSEHFRRSACDGGEAAFAGIWDNERKAAVKAVFDSSSSSVAARAWHKAQVELDAFASSWLEVSTAGCAAHERGDVSDLLYERERACLDTAKLALRASVDKLQHLDVINSGTVDLALRPLGESPDCSDTKSLLVGGKPPLSDKRATVDALWKQYHGLLADMTPINFDESLRLRSADLLARARLSGYQPLLAKVLDTHAWLEWQSGATRKSCDLRQEGYHVADASGDDLLAASFASSMLEDCIGVNVSAETATIWLGLIRTRFARSGQFNSLDYLNSLTGLGDNLHMLEREDVVSIVGHAVKAFKNSREHIEDARSFLRHIQSMIDVIRDHAERFAFTLQLYEAAGYRPVLPFKVYGAAKPEITTILAGRGPSTPVEADSINKYILWQNYQIGQQMSGERCMFALLELEQGGTSDSLRYEAGHELSVLMLLAGVVHAECGDVEKSRSYLSRFKQVAVGSGWGTMLVTLEAMADFEQARLDGAPVQAALLSRQILDWCRADLRCSTDVEWTAEALERHADATLAAGDLQQAASLASRAVYALASVWGEESVTLAAPLTTLGEAELGGGNPEAAARHLERAHYLRQNSDPHYRGRTSFALAKALHATGTDGGRARALGEEALAAYESAGPRWAFEYSAVAAWLASLG